ncbi:flagellar motor switch protein : Flagellar motor switch protein FliG OS=[Clostridium] bifermentans ATCC 638 GN=fliG PE=4 SV=1: FliG_M: FliG_C [Gemmataceae bacterium]|nr:flagellar motor switch protein : Flagellar motor switch protein FliG OS=[Clostridium] bifermentans ATCC 638 GN=fliG PE=4 SV=1: FliG_M: FliG_C [Gemmataceae bacterium]VTT97896.1 flagellar motor switch protein : Flagellar motor switch protein FliG OS=[Clostridium] bifermentans ATCC 638 GN=fliG PE=4 SV=1: FliG_M: FliG_C [Gemmataceae bacterium]
MADGAGDDIAVLLLRALPADVTELILGRLEEATAGQLRAKLRVPVAQAPSPGDLDGALAQFFDLQRIADRAQPATGAYSPVAKAPDAAAEGPIDRVRALPPERLAKALDGEQPGTVALVLSCLEPTAAGQVIKRMPEELRGEVALRLTKPGNRNPMLLRQLVSAVVAKAQRLEAAPVEPTQDELITNLANMLRAVPRAERLPIIRKIEAADADLAAKVMEQLYRIDDVLRIPNRQVQMLLGKLDVKTIAVALNNVSPELREKVSSNMSSRARTALTEECELLGKVPASRTREAQAKVMALVKKGEEEGEITLEE